MILVTRTEIMLKGSTVIAIAAVQSGDGPIAPLSAELGKLKATDGLAILQADADTDAKLINRIVLTAKAAGFDNVLFAVKNK